MCNGGGELKQETHFYSLYNLFIWNTVPGWFPADYEMHDLSTEVL